MRFKTAEISGIKLFYREAGETSNPAVVLLHGFPTSSHQFHELIPLLADRFHVLAPDYPGMGFSEAPDPAAPATDLRRRGDGRRRVHRAVRDRTPHLVLARHRRTDRNADRDGASRADRRPDFSEFHDCSGGLEP